MACINDHPKTSMLLRVAAKLARSKNLDLIAVHVGNPNHLNIDHETNERILRALEMAESMGAEIYYIENEKRLNGLVSFIEESFATENPIRHVLIGKTAKEGFFAELKQSLSDNLIWELRKQPVKIQTIPLNERGYTTSWFDWLYLRQFGMEELGFSIVAVVLGYLLSELLRVSTPSVDWPVLASNAHMIFLMVTMFVAFRNGLIPGLLAALLGLIINIFCYIEPFFAFTIDNATDGITVTVFIISSVIAALIGAYSHATQSALSVKESRNQALYRVQRLAGGAETRSDAMRIIHDELDRLLGMEVAFFMPKAMNPDELETVEPAELQLNENDLQSLTTCWQDVRTTGYGAIKQFESQWRFEPMVSTKNSIGVFGICIPQDVQLDPSFGRLQTALADQAASILERIELNKMMSESRVREEREKLRSMLLSSVSHDLKTPLASIIGSLSVYQRMQKSGRLKEDIARELTETAMEEAQRLDSFISNILEMTRIESGEINFEQSWVGAHKPIKNVVKRLRYRLSHHELNVGDSPEGVEVRMDRQMTEQVLQNVIDNAAKYAPRGTEIKLSQKIDDNGFSYTIRDQGPGIPDDKLEAVFDKYERLKKKDSQVAGTGLGLAIAKAVMQKQNGSITVKNNQQGGAEFTIWFPEVRQSEIMKAGEQ